MIQSLIVLDEEANFIFVFLLYNADKHLLWYTSSC